MRMRCVCGWHTATASHWWAFAMCKSCKLLVLHASGGIGNCCVPICSCSMLVKGWQWPGDTPTADVKRAGQLLAAGTERWCSLLAARVGTRPCLAACSTGTVPRAYTCIISEVVACKTNTLLGLLGDWAMTAAAAFRCCCWDTHKMLCIYHVRFTNLSAL